jgi:hypothetical protein
MNVSKHTGTSVTSARMVVKDKICRFLFLNFARDRRSSRNGSQHVQSWLKTGQFPKRKGRSQSSKIDGFLPYIQLRRTHRMLQYGSASSGTSSKRIPGIIRSNETYPGACFPKRKEVATPPSLERGRAACSFLSLRPRSHLALSPSA